MAPTNQTLNAAKARMLKRFPDSYLKKGSLPGTFLFGRHYYSRIDIISAPSARHAWLYAGDLHLGAVDADGLADELTGWYYRLGSRYNSTYYFDQAVKSLCGKLESHKYPLMQSDKPKRCKACLMFPTDIHGGD